MGWTADDKQAIVGGSDDIAKSLEHKKCKFFKNVPPTVSDNEGIGYSLTILCKCAIAAPKVCNLVNVDGRFSHHVTSTERQLKTKKKEPRLKEPTLGVSPEAFINQTLRGCLACVIMNKIDKLPTKKKAPCSCQITKQRETEPSVCSVKVISR